eukprot:TRINITY_DN10709_c0_g1_i1.p1 TRINITY_DN10709_c0_g1~~TRINITY_DN10709_c0_g1_i1.p1  ORF type:complete len:342 (+),score=45.74 TRINITY_DN10709_c0_g1_i1:73-1098(+)
MFGFNLNNFLGPEPGTLKFEVSLRCHSVALVGKSHLENGGKILLPGSALDAITQRRVFDSRTPNGVNRPMLFRLSGKNGRSTHCGVLEFVADEGFVNLPYWMMENLLVQEGDIIKVESVFLPAGTFVKIQPTDDKFLKLSNPKAVLERSFRNFAALTTGDIVRVTFNSVGHDLKVLEVKPDSNLHAITIINADVSVDFLACPQELARLQQLADEHKQKQLEGTSEPTITPNDPAQDKVEEPETKPRFPGSGMRIKDGKAVTSSAPPTTRLLSNSTPTSTATTTSTSNKPRRKLNASTGITFGAPTQRKPSTPPKTHDTPPKQEEPKKKFIAFSGQGYSLKG